MSRTYALGNTDVERVPEGAHGTTSLPVWAAPTGGTKRIAPVSRSLIQL